MVLLTVSIIVLLVLLSGICMIRWGLLIVTVEHQSMFPTLQHGDRVLALCRGFRRWIREGSIVLVLPPDSDQFSEAPGIYIKRVAALGEATITLPFAPQEPSSCADTATQQPILEEKTWYIPRNHLFVCGDNRASSVDSRQWGPMPLRDVQGLVLTRLRPVSPQTASRSEVV